jgi:hypothetical protein
MGCIKIMCNFAVRNIGLELYEKRYENEIYY